MTNPIPTLTAIGAAALIEFAAFLTIRSGALAWHEWHGSAGLYWPATIGLVCTLATAGVVMWLVIPLGMVRP